MVAMVQIAVSGEAVRQSYRHCMRLARRAASNFYWAFWLLPRAKRQATCALYAFARRCDDLTDSDRPLDERRRELRRWRDQLHQAMAGRVGDPLLPALVDTIRRYRVPLECLTDLLDGVAMDLEPCRYETFEQLQDYCQRVASAIGIACLHVWGFDGPQAIPLARDCGVAFQLTNVLRDLEEDAVRGRVYVPEEDFRRFGLSVEEFRRGVRDERLAELLQFEVARAERLFHRATVLLDHLHRDGRRAAGLMIASYWALLQQIKRRGVADLEQRPRLAARQKLRLAVSMLLGGGAGLP